MSKRDNSRPIASFFASILNLLLAVIVIKVILILADNRDASIPEAFGKEAKEVYQDLKSGWTGESKKDTIK